jgi:putative mRNA 3-end processing factor
MFNSLLQQSDDILEIHFLGGASEVGRSAIFLKGEENILLDYGIKIDGTVETPMQAKGVNAFILSHAHLDHSGFAPALYFGAPPITLGTAPTLELSNLLIEDSMKLAVRRNQKQYFYKKQLESFKRNYNAQPYGSPTSVGKYTITLHDAGHITGSALTLIENKHTERRLLYTGDFKLVPQILQSSAEIIKSDILIIESTYATREHPNREHLVKTFIEDIKSVLDNGGTALVPAFAVGRSQEILAMLYKHGLIEYTYLDGMAQKATEIVLNYPNFTRHKDLLLSALKNARWVENRPQRKSILKNPSIIVTTAGMLNGGPAVSYITMLNQNSKIFLTGYQIPGTNGRLLLDGKPIVIDNKRYKIKNPVAFYDFSAHAGKEDLYSYIKKSNPETVICVHGDAENTASLASSLELEGYKAFAPKVGETIKVVL